MGQAKLHRGRPRLKPYYDRASEIEELISTAVDLFAIPYDDRLPRDENAPTLVSVAEEIPTYRMKREEVKTVIFRYIFGYYNTQRINSFNAGGLPPVALRTSTGLAHHAT